MKTARGALRPILPPWRSTVQVPHATRRPSRWLGPLIDSGPMAVFFVAYVGWDVFLATAAMLVATFMALVLSYSLTRRAPVAALVSAAMLAVFGGLTLWLNDADYLKLQSTLLSSLFSLVLFGSFVLRRELLRTLFGASVPMSAEGWNVMTIRCAIFFGCLAALNELVARTQSTAVWVDFNVFGTTALGLVFVATQWSFLKRHRQECGHDRLAPAAPRRDGSQ
jgi:intracellular septation protein